MAGARMIGIDRISDPRTDGMRNTSTKDAVGEVPMSACSFSCYHFESTVVVVVIVG